MYQLLALRGNEYDLSSNNSYVPIPRIALIFLSKAPGKIDSFPAL
jgi:hypothetical protein